MGEPLKLKRIEDMSRLSWLEHVITEASLMTRSIRLHLILMNWMCFPLQVWGGFAPPAKNRGVWGARPPAKIFRKNKKEKRYMSLFSGAIFLDLPLQCNMGAWQ